MVNVTKYNDQEQILVSICCTVYNHSAYIRQCIDGFMMQKTNFRYEVLIHDDASTDGTQGIIREYERKFPEIIKPIYQKENQYSKGGRISIRFNIPRAKGKYIAFCEGDDYWIDPLKLQKQVDFLENNEEYYLVGMRNYIYDQKKNKIFIDKASLHYTSSFETSDYINHLLCHTSTFCLRKEYFYNPEMNNILQGDISLVLHCSNKGKCLIKVLKDFGSVYRIHDGGITNSANHRNVLNSLESLEKIYRSYDDYSCNKDHRIIEKKIKRNRIVMHLRKKSMDRFTLINEFSFICGILFKEGVWKIGQNLLYLWTNVYLFFKRKCFIQCEK